MTEIMFIKVIKNVSLFASLVGIVVGLDLLFFGAKIMSRYKKILDRIFNTDDSIIGILSSLRKRLDSGVDIDRLLIETKARITLGVVLLFFSVLMILLIVTTR
jgi:hypothetical protein